ncbi:transmembrane 56-B-like [Brachionus plicatilis]|uniref:Transmembrane 56-B-like n=1 Tax=Brachionus plicatilis TaxID=10195 RepID=A0A3M7QH00_BRAPC|nr:transmembrane 56-B-like [Brachionus plicatilis]
MNGTIYLEIVSFFLFFSLVFYTSLHLLAKHWKSFRTLNSKVQIQFVSRIVSSVHSVLVFLISVYILLTDEKISQKIIYSSPIIIANSCIVIAYFLNDLMMILWYRELFDIQFLLHHIVALISSIFSMKYDVFFYFVLMRLLSEGSTLFINIRWFLLSLSMKESKVYTINGLLVFIVFGLVRIVPIIPFWKKFYEYSNNPDWQLVQYFLIIICAANAVILDSLNIYWYSRIVSIVYKSLKQKKN